MGLFSSSPRNRRNQRTPSPRTTWSTSSRSSILAIVGDVPAHDDGGEGLVLADKAAHGLDFADVWRDAGDAHDVVAVVADFFEETVERGEIEQRARRLEVGLDEHDAPRPVKHAQRERALDACDLVVVELHRVDGAATVFVVLCVRAEDTRE